MPTAPLTPPHTPQPTDPATGRGRCARLSPFAPAPAPSASSPGLVGGAGLAGPGVQPGPSPNQECSIAGGGRAGDPAAWGGSGGGRGRRKSLRRSRRSRGSVPGAPLRAGSVAPVLRLPALLFPPPSALPRATAPAAGGAKLTYLEPDKQEPLRPGSQSPPRVTGAATANGRRCHEPLRPIKLHSGLRAPSRLQPMGTSWRRELPPGPQPPPPPPPRRRGAADWPATQRGGIRAPGQVGARGPGAAGAAKGGVDLWLRLSGSATRLGGVSRSSCCTAFLVPVTRSSLPGVQGCGGGSEGGMGPEADGGVTGNFGRLAWPRPGSGRAGGDKPGPPGRDYPAGRQPERNSEGGGGGVIKMLSVPAGCWAIPGAEISKNGSCFGTADPAPLNTHFSPSESFTFPCTF